MHTDFRGGWNDGVHGTPYIAFVQVARKKQGKTEMSSQSPESLLPRHEAFLRCEKVDRPLLGAWLGGYYPAEQFPQGHHSWQLGQLLQPADVRFEAFRHDYEMLYRLHREAEDDFFYVGSAYWGIPWLEAILGCAIHVGETSCWSEGCAPGSERLVAAGLRPGEQRVVPMPPAIHAGPVAVCGGTFSGLCAFAARSR